MISQLFHHGLLHVEILAQLLEVHLGQADPGRQLGQVLRVGYQQTHCVALGAVSVHADVLHNGTGLQFSFYFAERNVFAGLQFHEILLAICEGNKKML